MMTPDDLNLLAQGIDPLSKAEYQHGRGAIFSEDKEHRFLLWVDLYRKFFPPQDRKVWLFCMLNPSTADEFKDDPTVKRCGNRAFMGGATDLLVVNLFSYRSTNPEGLLSEAAGRNYAANDKAILAAANLAEVIVCGWGTGYSEIDGRSGAVRSLLQTHSQKVFCLGTNLDRTPKHPLYIALSKSLEPYPVSGEIVV